MGGICLSVTLALLSVASFAFGQAIPQPSGASAAKPSVAAKSKPAAEMGKLKFMLGRWRTVEKFEPSEGSPNGGEGMGRAVMHFGPGNLSVIENYGSKNNGIGPFGG